jgi:UDP-N-acetylglucosamine:LPS N-acetylglucosamine transferase
MTNLLILSSDTGEGHNSAARAIQLAAEAAGLQATIRKPLEESGALNRSLGTLYNALLTHRPQWMGAYFKLIDRCRPNERDMFYLKARPFIARFLDSAKPDVLLSVHPMLNHLIQRFVKEERLNLPCDTFVTDPFPPFWRGWASPYVDRYFVPTHEALQMLTAMGVPAWKIERVPMPVRPEFRPAEPSERDLFRSSLGLDDGKTVLINGGARGGGPLLRIYETVRSAWPGNLVVICGRNQQLRHSIEKLNDTRTRAFGYVEDIHRFVRSSDLVLTKPGALSAFEALACEVPVVLLGIHGLMPQESGLFDAARRHEFGFGASTFNDLRKIIEKGPASWLQLSASITGFYLSSSGADLIERIQPSHASA